MGRRELYTTSGFATRPTVRNGEKFEDVNIWNGTVLADSYEMARTLTLGAILYEWPRRDGWVRHEAFVRRIDNDVLNEWLSECRR